MSLPRDIYLCKAVTIKAYVDLLARIARATRQSVACSRIGLMSLMNVSSCQFEQYSYEDLQVQRCCILYLILVIANNEAITIEEPTIEEPTIEEPTIEEPTIEEPTIEEPTIEDLGMPYLLVSQITI
jgi:hypothetical protein